LLILLSTFVAAVLIGYFQVYRPQMRLTGQNQAIILGVVIDELARTYAEYTRGNSDVRFNVMEVRRRFGLAGSRSLTMMFNRGGYTAGEQALVYNEGDGACGRALAENDVVWFDRSARQQVPVRMPPIHEDVTRDVISVLSIPIYRVDDEQKARPIAIINLDSKLTIEHTKFDDPKVQELVMRSSGHLGIILH
jgi:hypothetical protein